MLFLCFFKFQYVFTNHAAASSLKASKREAFRVDDVALQKDTMLHVLFKRSHWSKG